MQNTNLKKIDIEFAVLANPIHATLQQFSEYIALKNSPFALHFGECYMDYNKHILSFGDINKGIYPVYNVDNIVYSAADYHRYIFFDWNTRKIETIDEFEQKASDRASWISVKKIQPYEITNLEHLILEKIGENEKHRNSESN